MKLLIMFFLLSISNTIFAQTGTYEGYYKSVPSMSYPDVRDCFVNIKKISNGSFQLSASFKRFFLPDARFQFIVRVRPSGILTDYYDVEEGSTFATFEFNQEGSGTSSMLYISKIVDKFDPLSPDLSSRGRKDIYTCKYLSKTSTK